MAYTGIILAGGENRRMGVDKAMLSIGPITFLEHIYFILKKVCEEIIVVGPKRPLKNINVRYIADQLANQGPLMGMYSGLLEAQHETCIITSVDAPFIDSLILTRLQSESKDNLTVFEGKRLWPFPGLYFKSSTNDIQQRLDIKQLRVIEYINQQPNNKLKVSLEEEERLININTPAEYNKWFENEIED